MACIAMHCVQCMHCVHCMHCMHCTQRVQRCNDEPAPPCAPRHRAAPSSEEPWTPACRAFRHSHALGAVRTQAASHAAASPNGRSTPRYGHPTLAFNHRAHWSASAGQVLCRFMGMRARSPRRSPRANFDLVTVPGATRIRKIDLTQKTVDKQKKYATISLA